MQALGRHACGHVMLRLVWGKHTMLSKSFDRYEVRGPGCRQGAVLSRGTKGFVRQAICLLSIHDANIDQAQNCFG